MQAKNKKEEWTAVYFEDAAASTHNCLKAEYDHTREKGFASKAPYYKPRNYEFPPHSNQASE